MPPIISGSYARKIQNQGISRDSGSYPRLPPRHSKKGLTGRREWGFTQRQTGRCDETAVKGNRNFGEFGKKM